MAVEPMMHYVEFVRWLEKRVDGFEKPKTTMRNKDGSHKEYYVSTAVRMKWLVHDYPDEWVAFITARRLAGDKYIGK